MLFHIELRTDDPELIRTLKKVKNRARFVTMALKHFVSTKRGREVLALMAKQDSGGPEKRKTDELSDSRSPVPSGESGQDINLDNIFF